MYFTFYFKKTHLIFLLYFFIELSKRLIKEKQNKLFNDNYTKNLQIFLSHTISILFYLIQNKNMGKEMNENKKKLVQYPLKNILNSNKPQKKNKKNQSLLLIFLSSILHLISYNSFNQNNFLSFDFINPDNTVGFFVIILFLIEKKYSILTFFFIIFYQLSY